MVSIYGILVDVWSVAGITRGDVGVLTLVKSITTFYIQNIAVIQIVTVTKLCSERSVKTISAGDSNGDKPKCHDTCDCRDDISVVYEVPNVGIGGVPHCPTLYRWMGQNATFPNGQREVVQIPPNLMPRQVVCRGLVIDHRTARGRLCG